MQQNNIEVCNKLAKLVAEIETRLHDEPVILDTEALIFSELERTSRAIEELAGIASQEDEFTQLLITKNLNLLREKIRTLYGRVHNLAVDGEYLLLKVEALLLGRALIKKNEENIQGQIDELKTHLVILKNNFRSTLRNQMVQDTAERFLSRVPEICEKEGESQRAVTAMEGRMQLLWKLDLLDPLSLGAIAEILEEADDQLPEERNLFLVNAFTAAFSHAPDTLEALLSLEL